MTKNDGLLPCPLPDCKDNKITRGYESGPMLYYVCCASPQHVLKVYGITQAFADERWNTRATPSHVAVDAKAVDAAITDAVHLIDYAMRGGHVHKREWQKVINGLLTAPKPDSKPVSGEVAHHDDISVDKFAAAMKVKLAKKRKEGRGGWEDKSQCTADFLSELLRGHVEKGDPVDVANLAMMLFCRGEGIKAAQQPAEDSKPQEVLPKAALDALAKHLEGVCDPYYMADLQAILSAVKDKA